jgi:hypothetical protein
VSVPVKYRSFPNYSITQGNLPEHSRNGEKGRKLGIIIQKPWKTFQ